MFPKNASMIVIAEWNSYEGSLRHMPRKHQRKLLGRYIVADPAICHGKPTFVGTRVMVAQVLKRVAKGMPWDEITATWPGAVSREAIAEAIELAQRTFEAHAREYAQELST
jgi:uncharacterized protein (DUF433 family)